MFTIWHLPYAKVIREVKEEKEALAYCKYLNLLCYSKANGAGADNCFAVSEVAF